MTKKPGGMNMQHTTNPQNTLLTLEELQAQLQRLEINEDELLSGAIPVEALVDVFGDKHYLDLAEEVAFFTAEGLTLIPYSLGMSHRMGGAYRLLHRAENSDDVEISVPTGEELKLYLAAFKDYDQKLAMLERILTGAEKTGESDEGFYPVEEFIAHLQAQKTEEIHEVPLEKLWSFIDENVYAFMEEQVLVSVPGSVAVFPYYLGAHDVCGREEFENQQFLNLEGICVPDETQKETMVQQIQKERNRLRTLGFLS